MGAKAHVWDGLKDTPVFSELLLQWVGSLTCRVLIIISKSVTRKSLRVGPGLGVSEKTLG